MSVFFVRGARDKRSFVFNPDYFQWLIVEWTARGLRDDSSRVRRDITFLDDECFIFCATNVDFGNCLATIRQVSYLRASCSDHKV